MSKFKKFFKKVGKGVKKVAKIGGKVLNGIGKVASATGIPIISQAGKLVDSIIPDSKVKDIVNKVAETGVVKVDKIEETVIKENPNATPEMVAEATKAIAHQASLATGAPVNDSQATVSKLSIMEKAMIWVKKPITWVVVAGVGIACFFVFKNKSGGRRRR